MSTIDWTLQKSYREERDPPFHKWPIYTWGNVEIEDYAIYDWRGLSLMAETPENPLTGGSKGLVKLGYWSPDDVPDVATIVWDQIAWWAEKLPGRIAEVLVKEDGELLANVWTGKLDIWSLDGDRHYIALPHQLLANRQFIEAILPGRLFVSEETSRIGHVGHIIELQPSKDTGLRLDRDVWGSLADLL